MRCRECAAEVAADGSGVPSVRGSDRWAAAGGGGQLVVADTVVGAVSDAAVSDARSCGEGCTCRGGRAGAAGAVCAGFRR